MTIFKIHSIKRQHDEEETRFTLMGREILMVARPIRAWKRCRWGTFNTFAAHSIQSPWLTFSLRKR